MGFNRDLVARAMAANAKAYAEAAIAAIPRGILYKGEVSYYSDLPTATAEVGDCYTVKYTGTSGTNPDGNEYVFGASGGTNTWIKLGPEDSGGLFYCTYGTTTFAQVTAALGAGKMPIVKTFPSGTYYIFAGLVTANSYGFSSLYDTTSKILLVDTSNNWTTTTTTLETTTNKVTSVSDQSTDTQYPTAKAVYDLATNLDNGISYVTTAPTGANTNGKLKVVVLSSEPANKYSGYLYFIGDFYSYSLQSGDLFMNLTPTASISQSGDEITIT